MDISVICGKCHARFKVSEKYAGQTGPCPKCKNPIRIPEKSEEVVIHAPEEFGPKDSSGRATLKPLEREEANTSPVMIATIVGAVITVLIVAFFVGRSFVNTPDGIPLVWLGAGALLMGPPLAVAGYALLRDTELAGYQGTALWLRATVCGIVFAILWGAYWYVKGQIFEGEVEMFHLVFIVPVMMALGGLASLASLELDYTTGLLHYGVYLAATVLLRLLMGMSAY